MGSLPPGRGTGEAHRKISLTKTGRGKLASRSFLVFAQPIHCQKGGDENIFPCTRVQVVSIVPEAKKVEWLLTRLPEMIDSGEVLVFANQIVRVEEVTEKIKAMGHR